MKRTGWYILLVRQGFELNIQQQFNSMMKELCIDEVLISPNLSGYVFVRSIEIPHHLLSTFLNFDGVLRFLGLKKIEGKNIPKRFSNSEISKLSLQPKKQVNVKFRIGDKVIIRHGDLVDIQGEIIELGKRTAKIKSTMFQKVVRTKVQDIELL
jgi:transcription antitermination factor NusG